MGGVKRKEFHAKGKKDAKDAKVPQRTRRLFHAKAHMEKEQRRQVEGELTIGGK